MIDMSAGDYRELLVWQKGMDLVEAIYRETKSFPKEELYGLTSQIRRAAVSVPSNIAEGKRRMSNAEFRRFLLISFGSGAEVETQIEIARRIGYLDQKNADNLQSSISELMRMLNALIASASGS